MKGEGVDMLVAYHLLLSQASLDGCNFIDHEPASLTLFRPTQTL